MKQILYFLLAFVMMASGVAVVAQPSNDNCANAQNLGTLPAPAACGSSTATKSGTTVTVSGTNVAATPSNPYPYNANCPPNTGNLPDDVWYSFTASSYQALITITGATFTNPIITVWEGTCTTLGSIGCVSGSGGAASLTVLQLTPGNTYYIQVSGSDGTQTGTFTLNATSQDDCANCLVSSTVTASPPPTNGTYAPGTAVTFCDNITSWNETSVNWLHGVTPTFGSGWNLSSIVIGTLPSSCSQDGGYWAWWPHGDTSTATGAIYGAGFYYETSSGNANGVIDHSPGDNFGDNGNCGWNFCLTITANNGACVPGSNLDVNFTVTGDGQSGSWSSFACQNDPVVDLYAVGSCCPPTMTSTPASCSSPNGGTATATPTGTFSPWTYHWSNGTVQTLSGPSTITGLAAGIDTVTVTDALNCTVSASVTIGTSATASAGPDQTLTCVVLPGGTVTMAASGIHGVWSAQAGNPGTATINQIDSPFTTITDFTDTGVYTFIWLDSGCNATTTVTVTSKPNAGPDQTVSCIILPGGSATMAALGTGTWTADPGNAGTSIITNPTSPTTTITDFSAEGTYYYTWTNGTCTDTTEVIVIAKPNAGPDQAINCVTLPGGSVTMAATGLGLWIAEPSNPGTCTITNQTSPTTTVTDFSAAGEYYFIWTIGACSDTMHVTVSAIVNAGPDQFVTCYPLNSTATMAASGAGSWTTASGNPGTATITNPTDPTTTITSFSSMGVYKFLWSNNGCTDTVEVTVSGNPDAGPAQTVTCATLPGGSATMAAIGTGLWVALPSNPGTATITTPSSPTTTITTYSAAGTYRFAWTSGSCADTTSVTVTAQPNAGADQTVSCVTLPGGSATTAATTATGIWTPSVTNPGTATIASPNSPATAINNFSTAGTYYFLWTNGSCVDSMSVTVTAKPNAGPDVTICPDQSATLNATGTGTWSAFASNPASTTIATSGSATTSVSGFTTPGTYGYIWTANGCADTADVIVNASPTLNPVAVNITCLNATGVIYANAEGSSPFTYQWSNATSADSMTTTNSGTLYTVTVTDFNGCTASASDSVSNLIQIPSMTDTIQEVSCYGYNDGQITIYPSPSGSYDYSWSNGESSNPATGLAPGSNYQVTITNQATGCSNNGGPYTITSPGYDSLVVTPLDTTITLGDTIQLNSTIIIGTYPVSAYSWSPTTGLSCDTCPNTLLIPTVADTVKTQYQLTITYLNGCLATASDSIKAQPYNLYAMPDAFTPNGDGKNDTFYVLATSVKSFKMNIYDRWGEMVFESNDINQGWDGTCKGKPQPADIYTYYFTLTYLNNKVVTKVGTLSLQR